MLTEIMPNIIQSRQLSDVHLKMGRLGALGAHNWNLQLRFAVADLA